MLIRKEILLLATVPVIVMSTHVLHAADPGPPAASGDQKYITVEEYEKYKKDMDAKYNAVLAELKKTKETQDSSQADHDAEIDELVKQMKESKHAIANTQSGFSNVVLVGDATFGYVAPRHGTSSFNADIAPLVLWKVNDKLLVEAAADLSVNNATSDGSGQTTIDLGIADASYQLCDYAIVGAGLFVIPFGRYHNHFDPGWINKLPDDPLVFSDGGLSPGSGLGAFIKGEVPLDEMMLTYDFYVTNGPRLITSDPNAAGSLSYDNYDDNNNNKAVGGRIGFLPLPELEVGYSFMYSQVNSPDFDNVDVFQQAGDFEYKRDFETIAGTLDARIEEVWAHTDSATYTIVDPTTMLPVFGPTTFNSDRQGGYVQLAYRPSLMNGPIRKFEGVVRYDWLISPESVPGGEDERRWTFGINYWLLPNAVIKTAYEFDHKKVGQSNDQLMLQFGVGF